MLTSVLALWLVFDPCWQASFGQIYVCLILHSSICHLRFCKTHSLVLWCRRTITLRKDKFDEREDDFYEALYTQSQAQFATYVSTGTVVNNYAHIFDLLIRLRQVHAAAHPEYSSMNCIRLCPLQVCKNAASKHSNLVYIQICNL